MTLAVADFIPINWGLVKNPYNWIIVLLMVFIAAVGLTLARRYIANGKDA